MAGLISAFCCFVVFMAAHIALFHLASIPNKFRAMEQIWCILLALYAVLYFLCEKVLPSNWASPSSVTQLENWVNFFNGILIYLLLFLSYCCFRFTDHSLSIAFMIELEQRLQRRMTLTELKLPFPYDALLKQRFGDIEANGFVSREGEFLCLTAKGRLYAGFFGRLKRFLKLEPGG
jgi:hypothetical protein